MYQKVMFSQPNVAEKLCCDWCCARLAPVSFRRSEGSPRKPGKVRIGVIDGFRGRGTPAGMMQSVRSRDLKVLVIGEDRS